MELYDDRGGRIALASGEGPSVLVLVGSELAAAGRSAAVLERVLELPSRLPGLSMQLVLAPLASSEATASALAGLRIAGPPESIRELAGAVGVEVAPEPGGWIAGHAVVVIDRSGRIARILRGVTGWDASDLAQAVAAAARH